MKNVDDTERAELIARLQLLEYAIRKSMTVREDQDEPAELEHKNEAEHCGIPVANAATKEELLNAVQTLSRATRKKIATASGNTNPQK